MVKNWSKNGKICHRYGKKKAPCYIYLLRYSAASLDTANGSEDQILVAIIPIVTPICWRSSQVAFEAWPEVSNSNLKPTANLLIHITHNFSKTYFNSLILI